MSILHVEREHDIRQDKLLLAFVVSLIVHLLLFVFFSQLAPLYRTPGIIKKKYEVLLLGKAEPESKGKELTREKAEKEKEEEKLLKAKEEARPEVAPPPPPPPPPIEKAIETPPPPPPLAPAEPESKPLKEVMTSEPSPVKAKTPPPREAAPSSKVSEKKPAKTEKTVFSSTAEELESKAAAGDAAVAAKASPAAGAPVPAGESYIALVKKLITKHWKYPPAAKINRIEGKVLVSFLLSKEGDVIEINVTTSSGYPILDDGVLRAIRKAEPFPSFAEAEDVPIVEMGGEQVAKLSITFEYDLEYLTMEH